MKETLKQISFLHMFLVSIFTCTFLILTGLGLEKLFGCDIDLIVKSLGILGLYFAPLIMLHHTLHKNNLSIKGWFQPVHIHIFETLGGVIFPQMLSVGILLLMSILLTDFNSLPTDETLNSSIQGTTYWVQNFIFSCLLAPFCEEILFRGFLFEKLQGVYSVKKAIVITSLVFGFMHGLNGIAPSIVSVVLCIIYKKYHSLIPCIAIHFVHNFLVTLLKYSISNTSTLESTSTAAATLSPMDILFTMFLISIGFIWLIRFIKLNWKFTYSEVENETLYDAV